MPDSAVAPREADVPESPSRRAREDARLFERYRRTGNQDARDELVERFLPLAKRLARAVPGSATSTTISSRSRRSR